MKQISILTIVLLCILTQNSCHSQEIQTMLQEQNLKGNVKSVSTTNGNEITETHFDETGKIIRRGTRYEWSIHIKDEYTYDNNGRLTSFSSYFYDSPHEKIIYKYEYDRKGHLISSGIGEEHTTRYKYKNGNCVLEKQPEYIIKRVYNKQNQVIEDYSYSEKRVMIHSWGEDENGYFERDELSEPYKGHHTYYKYNEHGDVSHITVKRKDLDEYTIDVAYIYDDKGNWIERTTTLNGELKTISCDSALKIEGGISGVHITRIIKYYD